MLNTILIISIFILLISFIFLYKNFYTTKIKYIKIKNEISKMFDISIKNPSDDFLLHQLSTNIKKLKERFNIEKYRRRNSYSILNSLSEGVILLSLHSGDVVKVDFANEMSKKIFTVDDYVGRSLAEIVDNHYLIDMVLKSFKKTKDIRDELLFYSPEKRYYDCKIKLTNIDDKYRIIILNDITKEKEIENLRREFLTTMSHELRTPLAVMNGYLETILMNSTFEKDTEKMLKIIEDESARLTRLVNDLIDLGKIEKNTMNKTKFKKVNLSNLIKKTYRFFRMLSEELNIKIVLEVEEDMYIYGEEDRVLQVIYNILDNSLKFTALNKKEENTIWIRLYKDNDSSNEVVFEVEDTGIGIPPKDIQKIFDMFYRVDKSRTRQITGFGLGLYIVKNILELHKARVFLESEENNGTLFRINFRSFSEENKG